MDKVLQALRAATRNSHERLHTHPALIDLTSPDVSVHFYTQALKKFYGFYLPHENIYARNGHDLLNNFAAHDITDRLKRDLSRQLIDADRLDVITLEEKAFSLEEILAYLYMREGSSLGGKVISKNLSKALFLKPGVDNEFFWGGEAEPGQSWRGLKQLLTQKENAINIEKTAAYAASLFQRLENWL